MQLKLKFSTKPINNTYSNKKQTDNYQNNLFYKDVFWWLSAGILFISPTQWDAKTQENTQLSSVTTNVYTIILKLNVIIVTLKSMLMKISFNVC